MGWTKNRRVLIVDDNPSIHADFRKILGGGGEDDFDGRETLLFGATRDRPLDEGFDVDSAFQGEEGIERVMQALREERPYALAFVDVRMPPGIDGIETIERIWKIDPDLQFVICSAYSDYLAHDILTRLGVSDRLLMLRKPCDSAEILLLATALREKWNIAESLRRNGRGAYGEGHHDVQRTAARI